MNILSSLLLVDTRTVVPVTIPVVVTGEHNGVNHWANATYTFNVSNGVAEEFGWLSNGDYKFTYYPADGKIKNSSQATGFALENGKNIPDCIVIPYRIEAIKTAYGNFAAKNIVLYAEGSNYSIFRGNADANTKIVIPEGVTELKSSVFAQNHKSNTNQEFILPSTLTTIGNKCFEQTSSGGVYKEIIIPDNVTTIGNSAFTQCRFNCVTIPKKVTTISGATFKNCNRLANITFKQTTAPTISGGAFSGIASGAVVKYPTGATGYDKEEFTSCFPEGTTFEESI